MALTVIQHVLSRLYELGVTDVFGVPGDYAFPINDAVCADSRLRWIGSCNELNAAYAADGYGRTKMGEKEESSMAELAVPIPDSIQSALDAEIKRTGGTAAAL